jgi:hypothetical protein
VDRIQLIHSIITDAPLHLNKGCRIKIEKYLTPGGPIKDYFPLHNYRVLFELTSQWQDFFQRPHVLWSRIGYTFSWFTDCACCCTDKEVLKAVPTTPARCCLCDKMCCPDIPWYIPRPKLMWPKLIDDVRDYFGEEIGMQALFLNHMTYALLFAAFVGVLTWIHIAYNGNDPNSLDIPYYSGFVGVWSTLMLEYFKRTQNYAAMRWGTTQSEVTTQEIVRHDYDGDFVESPIDGTKMRYASK